MFSGGEEGLYTDAEISLHTLLVKYYNDLLGRQSSEWGRDEVTYFYVGDVFGIYLGPTPPQVRNLLHRKKS